MGWKGREGVYFLRRQIYDLYVITLQIMLSCRNSSSFFRSVEFPWNTLVDSLVVIPLPGVTDQHLVLPCVGRIPKYCVKVLFALIVVQYNCRSQQCSEYISGMTSQC